MIGVATTFYTHHEQDYKQAWISTLGSMSFTFQVRTCSDAMIALSETLGNVDVSSYEVILGADLNRYVVIRDKVGGTNNVSSLQYGTVNCFESRSFWISWERNWLYVGRGTKVGQETMAGMSLAPAPKSIKAASLATKSLYDAQWSFPLVHGKICYPLFFHYLMSHFKIINIDLHYKNDLSCFNDIYI